MTGGSILLVGVGGQGVVLASAIIAEAALRSGFDVKQSEVHGMSQRGGVVSSHLRFGRRVHSPLIEPGTADAIVAMEWNEGLRALPALRAGAPLIVNLHRVIPPSACRDRRTGRWGYPAPALDALVARVGDVRACDAQAIARGLGAPKALNSVLLGVLAERLPFGEEAWMAALAAHVPPRTREANERAWRAGRALRYPQETFVQAGRMASLPDGEALHARRKPPVIELTPAWCKGAACDVCVRVCPERCLAIDATDRVTVVRATACTGCGLCELLCPDFAIAVREGSSRGA
jgi:indolepyruvate ferredoxin oxidoreductase beta subunit